MNILLTILYKLIYIIEKYDKKNKICVYVTS